MTRVTRFNPETRSATAQYAYPLDAVSAGPGGDNGLTDLVAVDDQSFLALERGYGTHVAARIYRVSVGNADDVLSRLSLSGAPVRVMSKSLLVDLTKKLGSMPLNNVEDIALGPELPDGRQSVVLVSDDNFARRRRSPSFWCCCGSDVEICTRVVVESEPQPWCRSRCEIQLSLPTVTAVACSVISSSSSSSTSIPMR